jgi:hypothetical protein
MPGIEETLILLLFVVLPVVGLWQVFVKAGEKGWKAIIPIYNLIVLLKVVGREWWWVLLWLVPIVGIVVGIVICHDLSKAFGHGVGFTIGPVFLPMIFLLILGFGSSSYRAPAG